MENLLLTGARPRRKPTPHGGSDGRKTYRYRRIGWKENLLLTEERMGEKPTATGETAGKTSYRYRRNSREDHLRLPDDNLSSPHIGDDLGVLVNRAVQH